MANCGTALSRATFSRLVGVRVGEDSGQKEGLELVREAARGPEASLTIRSIVEGARVARASRIRDDGRVDREDVRLDGQSLRIGDFGRGWSPGPRLPLGGMCMKVMSLKGLKVYEVMSMKSCLWRG